MKGEEDQGSGHAVSCLLTLGVFILETVVEKMKLQPRCLFIGRPY